MDDKQLFEAWKGNDKNEQEVFEQHKKEFMKLAKRQSNDLFSKIKRNIVLEGALSIVVAIAFPITFWSNPIFFWVILVVMAVALLASIKVYGNYWKDMKHLEESSLMVSLEKKLTILRRYIKQLKMYLYIFLPIGFALGLAFALQEGEIYLNRVLFISVFCLPFLGLMLWLGNKYIYALYGKYLNRIEKIYENLKEN